MVANPTGRILYMHKSTNTYCLPYGRVALCLVATLLLTLPPLPPTAQTGQIRGVVKDPDQALVSGTQVVLTNQQTKGKATAVTDSQGAYAFPSLQPGAYVVEAGAANFKASVSPELQVTAGQTVNFDFALTLAGVAQSVNVTAGA